MDNRTLMIILVVTLTAVVVFANTSTAHVAGEMYEFSFTYQALDQHMVKGCYFYYPAGELVEYIAAPPNTKIFSGVTTAFMLEPQQGSVGMKCENVKKENKSYIIEEYEVISFT